ncbi:MAG: hypothetical protein E6Y86_04655 [Slackia sp.]|uniref:hypothetical protein n=1 Tax=uncultured Slackia sp. TaxID=665903 RepID=UPI002805FDF3|nr:hypothetical protein [uncultured Slackia sp.]MDU6011317.1 hypothetical protein [Slackia sp.]
MKSDNDEKAKEKALSHASIGLDNLPDGNEVHQDILREAVMQLRKVQMKPHVRQAILEIL